MKANLTFNTNAEILQSTIRIWTSLKPRTVDYDSFLKRRRMLSVDQRHIGMVCHRIYSPPCPFAFSKLMREWSCVNRNASLVDRARYSWPRMLSSLFVTIAVVQCNGFRLHIRVTSWILAERFPNQLGQMRWRWRHRGWSWWRWIGSFVGLCLYSIIHSSRFVLDVVESFIWGVDIVHLRTCKSRSWVWGWDSSDWSVLLRVCNVRNWNRIGGGVCDIGIWNGVSSFHGGGRWWLSASLNI